MNGLIESDGDDEQGVVDLTENLKITNEIFLHAFERVKMVGERVDPV